MRKQKINIQLGDVFGSELLPPEPVLSHTVHLRDTEGPVELEKAINYSFVNTLSLLLDPLDRQEYDISVKTADDLVAYLGDVLGTKDIEKNLSKIDDETSTELLKRIRQLCRLLFAVLCASKGYLADDYIEFDNVNDVLKYNKLDIVQELDILLGMHQILNFFKLPDPTKTVNPVEMQKMSDLLKLLKAQNNEELLKENIESVFKTTLSRLEFQQTVEKDEVYELVVQSCQSDFGAVLYLLQERIELLYEFRIVEILLDSLKVVAAGNDLRRKRAFYKGLLNIIEHLDNYDLNRLSDKYISCTDMFVPKWITFIREVEVLEGKANNYYEAVSDEVEQIQPIEKLVPYIYLWAVLAPLDPFAGLEDFFKRIARTLLCKFSDQAKLNFIQAFSHLVPKCRQIFFNQGATDFANSLYYVVYHLIKEMQPEDFKKRGCHAIDILLDRLCPRRMVEFLLPYMDNDMLPRHKVAICVQHLLKNEKLLTMIRQAGASDHSVVRMNILNRLLDFTLTCYYPPLVSARFQFIDTTLSFLSAVYSKHITTEELEYFLTKMQKTPMEWYQLVVLKYGFFEEWECDLPKMEFNAENIVSYSDLIETSFFKPLCFWTGKFFIESFSTFHKKFLSHICPVMISCALLEQLYIVQSIARSTSDSIHEFITNVCVLPEQRAQLEDEYDDIMESVKEVLNVTLETICSDDEDDKDGKRSQKKDRYSFLTILSNTVVPEDIRTTIRKVAELKNEYKPHLEIPMKELPPSVMALFAVNDQENEIPLDLVNTEKLPEVAQSFHRNNRRKNSDNRGAKDMCETVIFKPFRVDIAERMKSMLIGRGHSNISQIMRNFSVNLRVTRNKKGVEVILRSENPVSLDNAKQHVEQELTTFKNLLAAEGAFEKRKY